MNTNGNRLIYLTETLTKHEAVMTIEEARQRIESAIAQFGPHAGMAIDLVINEVRGDQGREAANALIDEFDLELEYNIAPIESGSGD